MRSLGAVCLAALALGCTQRLDAVRVPEVQPEGRWVAQLTYGENGCAIESWPQLPYTLSGVELDIAPQPDAGPLSGVILGFTGGYVAIVLGDNVFRGGLDAQGRLRLRLDGRYTQSLGPCPFVVGVDLVAVIEQRDGAADVMTGTLSWTRRLQQSAACDPYRCVTSMSFVANRTRVPDAGLLAPDQGLESGPRDAATPSDATPRDAPSGP